MSIGLSEFWTRLVRTGLTDAAGCKAIAGEFANQNEGSPIQNVSELARFLVRRKTLTAFQAKSLLADPAVELRLGPFIVRSDQPPRPFTRWVDVDRIDDGNNHLAQGSAGGVMIRTTPGNPWLDAHASVNGPSLQPIQVETLGDNVAVFSPLARDLSATSGSLAGLLVDGLDEWSRPDSPMPRRRVCQWALSLSGALARMHAAGFSHGGVYADRVWVESADSVVLLRDPAGPPSTGLGDDTGQWLGRHDAVEQYVAPEIADASTSPTPASDVYSLGCLLFRLASGRMPFDGGSAEQTRANHRLSTPSELSDAVQAGAAGNPLYRVLAYAMAKDPAARFPNAEAFATALEAVLQTLASEPEPEPEPEPEEKVKPEPKRQANPGPKVEAKSKSKPDPKPEPKPKPKPEAKRKAAAKSAAPVQGLVASPKVVSKRDLKPEAKPVQTPKDEPKPKPEAKPKTVEDAKADAPNDVVADAPDDTEPPARPMRRRRRKPSKSPYVLGALAFVVLLLMVALLVTDPNPTPVARIRKRPPMPAVIPSVTGKPKPRPAPEAIEPAKPKPASDSTNPSGYQIVDDDRLLFAPPVAAATDDPNGADGNAGEPVTTPSLRRLPPGPAMIVTTRLASIQQSATGRAVIETLSPELPSLIEMAVARAKVDRESISQITAAFHRGQDGWPEVSLAVELSQAQTLDSLLDRWQVSEARTADGKVVYAGDEIDADAFFVSSDRPDDSVSAFAVGSLDRITEVASIDGAAIVLPRSLETLWRSTHRRADVIALVTPNFLFADGREMLTAAAPELVAPLRKTLIPDAAGAVLRLDIDRSSPTGERVFVELRLSPSGGISEAALMRKLSDTVATWPDWADQFIIDSVPDPSWRLLASRMPSMMRFASESMRFGLSDNMVVANTYLPGRAVDQLTLATLLAANTPAGQAVAAAPTSTPPLSIDEMLDRPMTVSFDQESLEFAIDAIVDQFQSDLPDGSQLPPVRIVGGDLQKMGITQNQQIRDFAKTDLPLRTVLTDLVFGANPDKTTTDPTDPKQALVWVVTDDPDNPGQNVILVTTRQAADGKYTLPTEFVAAE